MMCEICGDVMIFNRDGGTGDPVWVCLREDAAHRDARRAAKEAGESSLAAKSHGHQEKAADDIAAAKRIGAESRPASGK